MHLLPKDYGQIVLFERTCAEVKEQSHTKRLPVALISKYGGRGSSAKIEVVAMPGR